MGGNQVDLDKLDKICAEHREKYGFKPVVVEDCAHSFGAEYNGKKIRCENDIPEWGFKFHMNDINATIGVYNFPYIDNLLKKNRANSLYFDQHLKDIDGIKLTKTIQNVILHIGFIVFVYCMVKKKNS